MRVGWSRFPKEHKQMMETISRANKILMILIEFHECFVCEQIKKLCNWLRWGGASLAPCVLAKIDQGGSSCPTFTLFRSVRNLFGNRSLGQPFKWWQTLWKSTRVNLACSANKAEFVLLVSRRGCESLKGVTFIKSVKGPHLKL